jgi:hypothetical protein
VIYIYFKSIPCNFGYLNYKKIYLFLDITVLSIKISFLSILGIVINLSVNLYITIDLSSWSVM